MTKEFAPVGSPYFRHGKAKMATVYLVREGVLSKLWPAALVDIAISSMNIADAV